MDIANKVEFYVALVVGAPTLILSCRCIVILLRKEYRKIAFCKIFIASLVFSSLTFILLMHNLRFAGQGFFPEYYELIKNAWWQPLHSWTCRVCYVVSLMCSFALSLNRVTALHLDEQLVDKIWFPFPFVYLPLMIVLAGVLHYDVLVNRAGYVRVEDTDGTVIYQFRNYDLTRMWNSYWMMFECAADLLCNVLILIKFAKLRMGQFKTTPFEKSLYLIGFTSFSTHTVTVGIQTIFKFDIIPPSMLNFVYFISNTFLDITVLLPTIAILCLTKEIRTAVRQCFSFKRGRSTSVKISPPASNIR